MPRSRIPPFDWFLAACVTLFALLECDFIVRYGPAPEYVLNVILHAGLVPATLYRRVRVLPAFFASYSLLGLMMVLDFVSRVNMGVSPAFLCAPLSLLAVTRWATNRRWGVVALMLGIGAAFVSPLRTWGEIYLGVAACTLTLVVCFLYASRQRSSVEKLAVESARRIEQSEILVARAREAERMLIAREVHDIVAHSLTVIRVQAAVGLTLSEESSARTALETIKSASGTALSEVRGLVENLRDAETAPAGDLLQLPVFVAAARSAGVQLTDKLPDEETLGDWRQRWPAQSRLTLLRVVQEGLTNVIKHAGPRAEAYLEVVEQHHVCSISVRNSWSGSRNGRPTQGYGLLGLAERVRISRGTLEVLAEDGQFVLNASIPVRPIMTEDFHA